MLRIEQLGIGQLAAHRAETLSGGQQQRVANVPSEDIATAFANAALEACEAVGATKEGEAAQKKMPAPGLPGRLETPYLSKGR